MKINENQKVTLTVGQLKRLVKESINEGEKDFEDVEKGDIGHRDGYDNLLLVVIDKGPASEMVEFDTTGAIREGMEEGYIEDGDPCVYAQSPEDGKTAVWVYGDGGLVVEWEMGNIKNITKL